MFSEEENEKNLLFNEIVLKHKNAQYKLIGMIYDNNLFTDLQLRSIFKDTLNEAKETKNLIIEIKGCYKYQLSRSKNREKFSLYISGLSILGYNISDILSLSNLYNNL
jgi:hypothetical protein